MTIAAQTFDDTNHAARLEAAGAERLKDPKLSLDERSRIDQDRLRTRMAAMQQLLMGLPDTLSEAEKATLIQYLFTTYGKR